MKFHVVTLFPQSFDSYINESILKRAREDKKISIKFYDPKDFLPKKKKLTYADRRVDDKPYGGGPGMVIEALPVIKAIAKAVGRPSKKKKIRIIFFTPQGEQCTTSYVKGIAEKYTDIVMVCGRYEGIDARVKKIFKMHEVSIGPYVLTGGELPAMILIDTIARQVKGVLGNFDSREEERHASNDVYTRPAVITYKGKKLKVPDVLLGGNHALIEKWRAENAQAASSSHNEVHL